MKCPNCPEEHMCVTHVYSAGDRAESRNLRCPTCGFKSSSITFLIERPQGRKYGLGGQALASKILSGKIQKPNLPS
jgi:hypothetical protein